MPGDRGAVVGHRTSRACSPSSVAISRRCADASTRHVLESRAVRRSSRSSGRRRPRRLSGLDRRGGDAGRRASGRRGTAAHGFETLEALGERGILSTVAAYLAETLYVLGRDEEAVRSREVSEEAAADDDLASQILWRSARAKAAARQGRSGEAEGFARDAVALAEGTDAIGLHADALASLGDRARRAGARRRGQPRPCGKRSRSTRRRATSSRPRRAPAARGASPERCYVDSGSRTGMTTTLIGLLIGFP